MRTGWFVAVVLASLLTGCNYVPGGPAPTSKAEQAKPEVKITPKD